MSDSWQGPEVWDPQSVPTGSGWEQQAWPSGQEHQQHPTQQPYQGYPQQHTYPYVPPSRRVQPAVREAGSADPPAVAEPVALAEHAEAPETQHAGAEAPEAPGA
ncbi:hypothetical protein ACWGIU_25550, partial [Streptomyces sp. NPDC054840]